MLSKQLKMKRKNKKLDLKGGKRLQGTWGASLLGNLLTGKGVKAIIIEQGVIRLGEEMIRTDQSY